MRTTYGSPRSEVPSADDAAGWIAGRLPDDWFADMKITIDRDEILIVGELDTPRLPAKSTNLDRSSAESSRIELFRESTRERRIQIAEDIQYRYRRKCSWGVVCGDTWQLFTTLSAPVMTRLRQSDRLILDTLVEANVARSRSEALAWCVRLVGEHADEWLDELREAMASVDKLRRQGPRL